MNSFRYSVESWKTYFPHGEKGVYNYFKLPMRKIRKTVAVLHRIKALEVEKMLGTIRAELEKDEEAKHISPGQLSSRGRGKGLRGL